MLCIIAVRVHSAAVDPGLVLDDRFELLSAVRGGVMGDFWRALDRASQEVVAVRTVDATDAFLRVLDELIADPAPGMVALIAHGPAPHKAHYLALHMCEGVPLRDVLDGAGLTMQRAVATGRAVARCLAHVHARGGAHGGIDGARILVGAAATVLEPVPGGGSIDGDLRALGAVLYFALTGCEPGATPDRRAAPALPAALIELVGELLAPRGPLPAAAQVADRLAALDGLDTTYAVKRARVSAEATADLRGGNWLTRLGRDDTLGVAGAQRAATPDLDRDAEAGTSLVVKPTDRYQLKEVVGQGGLGRVVLAHDRELDRPVAIKELLRRTPSNVQRFRREALVTARLQHPAIVPVHDAGRWPNGAPYYAMKLVEGEDLSARIAAAAGLPERLALLPKLVTVCEAMAYAHAQRIIHRDLKPSNVVIGEFGEAMIVDWGLAKDLDAAESPDAGDGEAYREAATDDLTREGDVLGTPAYMSPEQARGEPVDARTDVYALGAMLYHLLVGRAPYAESTSEATAAGYAKRGVRAVIAAPPEPLAERVPDAPPELLAIVDKAMERAADDRYPTALELAAELQRYATGQLVAAHHYSASQLLRRWARKHRTGLIVAAVATCALLAVGGFAVVRIIAAERVAQRERGTAVSESQRADAARLAAEAERNTLRVLQAEQALATDPTEALRWVDIEGPLSPELHARAVKVARQAVALGVSHTIVELPGQIVGLAGAGYHAAAVSSGGTATMWTNAGEQVLSIALGAPGSAVALSTGGDQLVVAAEDRRARWWDTPKSAPREIVLPSPARRVAFVAEDRVVLALADGSVAFWSRSGELVRHAVHEDAPVALLVLRGDAITASEDGTLARTAISGPRWTITAHAGGATDAFRVQDTFSAADDVVVSAGADGAIRRWRATDGHALAVTMIGHPLAHITGGGEYVVATSDDPMAVYRIFPESAMTTEAQPFTSGAVCWGCGIWGVTTVGPRMLLQNASERRVLDGHRDRITAVVAAGRTLVSGDRSGVVRFWDSPEWGDVIDGRATTAPATTPSGWIVGLASGRLQRIQFDGPEELFGELPDPVTMVAASPQDHVIAAASRDRFRAWSWDKQTVDVAASAIRVSVSTDGAYVALLGEHGQVWNARTGELLVETAEAGEFLLVAGTHAYTAVPSGVLAFDLAAPAPRRGVLHPLAFDPNLAAVLPAGGLVVAASSGVVQILDGATIDLGRQVMSLQGGRDWISAGGGDGTIYRWRPSDGARAELRGGHARWVHGVTSPDFGDHLASWSWATSTLRLWNAISGAIDYIPTLEPVLGAAYNVTGAQLVLTDRSGTMRIVGDAVDKQAQIPPGGLATFVHQHLRGAR